MEPNDPDQPRKRVIKAVIIIVAALVFLIILIASFAGGNQTAETPVEVDAIPEADFDTGTQANIVGGDLVQQIGNVEGYTSFSQDLHDFGRQTYDAYKDPIKPVGFQVTSEVTKENATLTFDGKFGSSSNNVAVTIELLKNNRIKVSITDTKTGVNMDNRLPSNTPVNRFIGTLPIHGNGYDITFVPDDNVAIVLYDRNPALYTQAYQTIVEAIGESGAGQLNLTTSFPSASSEF